jgi:RHH-type rel operon transcriptional repressor/antitoxin RelB
MTTSIKLSSDVSKRLDRLAEKTGRTKAFFLRLIIESGLSDMEDFYSAAEAQERARKDDEEVLSPHTAGKEAVPEA